MKNKHRYLTPLVVLLILLAALCGHAQEKFFIKIVGQKQGQIKGSSTEKEGQGKIEGLDFTVYGEKGTLITRNDNAAFPRLQQAMATNETLKTAVLEFYKPDENGAEGLYRTVTLTNVHIIGISKKGTTTITLKFEKIERALVDKNS
jgi:type VI secretion system Hcp family effector